MDSDDGRLPADSADGHAGDLSAAGDAPRDALPTGWVAVVQNHWLADFMSNGLWLVFVVLPVVQVARIVVTEASGGSDFLMLLGFFGLGLLGVLLWYRFRPIPYANFQTSEVRRGRRTISMTDVRWARLRVLETQKSRSVTLQFGTGTLHVGADSPRHGIASYAVRTAGGKTPPAERARIVAEVLRRSSIELPETPDDPTGKFTWFNFPGCITREQAIEIVLNPPGFGDPLPVPSSHMYDPPRPGSKPGAQKKR